MLRPTMLKYLSRNLRKTPQVGALTMLSFLPALGKMLSIFYPKNFIWCPSDHCGLEVRCPENGRTLQVGGFTDEVEKKSPRNPRLGYDLRGNILIIQRYYVCCQKGKSHRYQRDNHASAKHQDSKPWYTFNTPRSLNHSPDTSKQ